MVRPSQGRFDEFGFAVFLDESGEKLAHLLCSRVIREASRVNRAYVTAIDVDVLDNESFNAIAAADSQGEGVVVFRDLPETLVTASAGWLSRDIAWTDVGDVGSGTIGSLPLERHSAVFAVEAVGVHRDTKAPAGKARCSAGSILLLKRGDDRYEGTNASANPQLYPDTRGNHRVWDDGWVRGAARVIGNVRSESARFHPG